MFSRSPYSLRDFAIMSNICDMALWIYQLPNPIANLTNVV